MRHFRVTRDLDSGHKAGEVVSDLRLPRADLSRLLTDGSLEELHEFTHGHIISLDRIVVEAQLKKTAPPGPHKPPRPQRPNEVA